MSKYPCNVIKDLLPSFIDNVCSKETAADIEEHLNECASCKALYDSMKEDLPGISESSYSSMDEKIIIQKVNKKINSKDKTVKIVCIAICALVILAAFLFIVPIKKIPKENLSINVSEEPLIVHFPSGAMTEKTVNPDFPEDNSDVNFNSRGAWQDDTIFIFPSDKNLDECTFYPATIENYPDYSFAIDVNYLEYYNVVALYIDVITISSDYSIKTYNEEYRTEGDKLIFNLKNARTTLFGKQATNVESSIVLFSIDKIDDATVYAK